MTHLSVISKRLSAHEKLKLKKVTKNFSSRGAQTSTIESKRSQKHLKAAHTIIQFSDLLFTTQQAHFCRFVE